MRLRKLFMLLVMIGVVGTCLQSIEVEPLVLPEPPEWQEGDDAVFEITIGEARRALYYKGLVPILVEYGEEVRLIAIRAGEDIDWYRGELQEERGRKENWRAAFLGLAGAVGLGTAIVLLVQ